VKAPHPEEARSPGSQVVRAGASHVYTASLEQEGSKLGLVIGAEVCGVRMVLNPEGTDRRKDGERGSCLEMVKGKKKDKVGRGLGKG
jgi:hypothetical protein